MAQKPAYYMVIDSLVGDLDGAAVEYRKGEVVDADDPAVRKWPHHFGPLVVRGHRPVEQATAAPGELRDIPQGRAITTDSFKGR